MSKHPLGCQWVFWDLMQRRPRDPSQRVDFHNPHFDLTESVVTQQAACKHSVQRESQFCM